VADAIVDVLARVPAGMSVPFRDLVTDTSSRLDVVVRFLAVLELFKQGLIDLEQVENFGTLSVRRLVSDDFTLDEMSVADWDEPAAPPSGKR
jgi:segregation and condensation protein A